MHRFKLSSGPALLLGLWCLIAWQPEIALGALGPELLEAHADLESEAPSWVAASTAFRLRGNRGRQKAHWLGPGAATRCPTDVEVLDASDS